MKVISLNTWGGEAGLPKLLSFFRQHDDVDIFCLQEIWNGGEHMKTEKAGGSWLENRVTDLFPQLCEALPDHDSYFRPHFFDFYGLAMFVKKGITVHEEGELFIYGERGFVSSDDMGNHSRNLQYVVVETERGKKLVVNLHGLWNGRGKTDTEERLLQSEKIIELVNQHALPSVILGDFNLLPTTMSVQKLEDAGLRNMIKECGITSTRTSYYTKPEKFADYAFASDGVEVKEFKVLDDEVSDHSPLFLEFA